jgi:hypothetical protein
MGKETIGTGALDLMDAIAGASATDIVLSESARRGQEGAGRRAFERLPLELRIERAAAAMDAAAVAVCAERNGIPVEEQAGRVEAVLLAWRIGGSGGTVMAG